MDEQGPTSPPTPHARDAFTSVEIAYDPPSERRPQSRISRWLLQGLHHGATPEAHPTYPWWKVM